MYSDRWYKYSESGARKCCLDASAEAIAYTRSRAAVNQQIHSSNAFSIIAILLPTALGYAKQTASGNAKADAREVVWPCPSHRIALVPWHPKMVHIEHSMANMACNHNNSIANPKQALAREHKHDGAELVPPHMNTGENAPNIPRPFRASWSAMSRRNRTEMFLRTMRPG